MLQMLLCVKVGMLCCKSKLTAVGFFPLTSVSFASCIFT